MDFIFQVNNKLLYIKLEFIIQIIINNIKTTHINYYIMEFIEKKLDGNLLVDLADSTDNNNKINEKNERKEIIEGKKINESNERIKISEYNNNKSRAVLNSIVYSNKLTEAFKHRPPSCGLIVIDNFYNNAQNTRDYILTQEFLVRGNYPGQRTVSYANEHLRDIIQKYVEPFGGKITEFPIPDESDINNTKNKEIYNGSFQYTIARDRSWVHTDSWNNWAGVLYLTPDAPLSAGTAFYRFKNGEYTEDDVKLLNTKEQSDKCSQDLTKWELVDKVGNIFNRLILFNSKRFHMSMDYFGDTKENGRLFQVFFFSTER